MTRINVGIPVEKLSGKHLIAEHREIKRVPNAVKKRPNVSNLPESFRLGPGHVRFFYNKLGYLKERYEQLYQECKNRGYNVTYFGNAWDGVPQDLMGSWTPTVADIKLIEERIIERKGGREADRARLESV